MLIIFIITVCFSFCFSESWYFYKNDPWSVNQSSKSSAIGGFYLDYLELIKSSKNQKFKIFSTNSEPKVSLDYFNDEHSLIYDIPWSSKVGNLFHSVIWYDNENGYSARAVDNLKLIFS